MRLLLELARERANRGRQFRVAYALSAISRESNRPIQVGWQGGDTILETRYGCRAGEQS